MDNNTPSLYALTPITDTEGLEDGKWYIVKTTDGDAHEMLFDEKEWHGEHEPYEYLRPLPEGTVAVSEEDWRIVVDALRDIDLYADVADPYFTAKQLAEIANKALRKIKTPVANADSGTG